MRRSWLKGFIELYRRPPIQRIHHPQIRALFAYSALHPVLAKKPPFLNDESLACVQHAWQHWIANAYDLITPALRRSFSSMPSASPEERISSWLALFGIWYTEEGWFGEQFQDIWPHFTQAASLEPSEQWIGFERLFQWWIKQDFFLQQHDLRELHFWWRALQKALSYETVLDIPAETLLDWWSELWYHYWGSDNATLPDCPLEPPIDPELYIELIQQLLTVSNKAISPSALARLWHDLLTQGLIPKSSRYRITALYLTVFGQAIIKQGEWRVGMKALLEAIKLSWHPQALKAWGMFFRKILLYTCDCFTKRILKCPKAP